MVAIAKRAFSDVEDSQAAGIAFYTEDDELLPFEQDDCEAESLIPTGNELSSSFAQPVGAVVLHSGFAQPVGKACARRGSPAWEAGNRSHFKELGEEDDILCYRQKMLHL